MSYSGMASSAAGTSIPVLPSAGDAVRSGDRGTVLSTSRALAAIESAVGCVEDGLIMGPGDLVGSADWSGARASSCPPVSRARRWLRFWRPKVTVSWPSVRALRSCTSRQALPFIAISGRSSTAVSRMPAGAKTSASSVRWATDRSASVLSAIPSSERSAPAAWLAWLEDSSDTVPAEHLLLVGQLARVLHQEAGPADELVGLLGQDPLGGSRSGRRRRRPRRPRARLRRQPFLQDHVEAGLDVLVVGLLLLFVLGLLSATPVPSATRRTTTSSTTSPTSSSSRSVRRPRPSRSSSRRRHSRASSSRSSTSSSTTSSSRRRRRRDPRVPATSSRSSAIVRLPGGDVPREHRRFAGAERHRASFPGGISWPSRYGSAAGPGGLWGHLATRRGTASGRDVLYSTPRASLRLSQHPPRREAHGR